jgi:sugar phosphate isomerase/epimerase
MRLGVFTDALAHLSLGEALDWIERSVPDVRDVELGTGGYSDARHCDVAGLLSTAGAGERFVGDLRSRRFDLSALNVSGNPLEQPLHDRALRDTIRLARELRVDRIVCMSGGRAELGLPGVEDEIERYWQAHVLPYWEEITTLAEQSDPTLRLCLELEPGAAVFNVSTFERLAALSPSVALNLDPSHFFWQSIDPLAVASRLARYVGFVHGKDVQFDAARVAVDGVLDRTAWHYGTVGRGHPVSWWGAFIDALRHGGYDGIVSIEHEDPDVTAEEGLVESAETLRRAIGKEGPASRALLH